MFTAGRPQPTLARVLRLLLCIVLLVLTSSVAACGSSSEGTSTTDIQGKQVTFTTEDGVLLSGHLFGTGTDGVVLSHMYPADQKSWYPTAKRLASLGYLVLTYDFRGYGFSDGTQQIEALDRDVLAACGQIKEAGATRVVLIGASMGGTASLKAAAEIFDSQLTTELITVSGVATLSAPVSFKGLSAQTAVADIFCPLLFVAAKEDVGTDEALDLERLSGNTGDLQIVSGADHGTDLLTGSQADKVYDLLVKFLRKNLPAED